MSDVLTDPDFLTWIQVTRQIVTVDNNGLRVVSQQLNANVPAVVTQNDDIDLLRESASERLSGSITIHTQFRLTDGKQSQSADADLVLYQDRTYTVVSIGDWSQWGRGFIMAIASLTQINP